MRSAPWLAYRDCAEVGISGLRHGWSMGIASWFAWSIASLFAVPLIYGVAEGVAWRTDHSGFKKISASFALHPGLSAYLKP